MRNRKAWNTNFGFLICCWLKIPILTILSTFLILTTGIVKAQNIQNQTIPQKHPVTFVPPNIVTAGKPTVRQIKSNPISVPLAYRRGKDGEILIEGDYGGIANFINYNTEQGLPMSSISSAYNDSKGNLWFGTSGAGICRYDGKSFITYNTENGLANNNVLCIFEDDKGNLWFGTNGGGASCYNGKYFKNYSKENGLLNNNVYSICQDKKGNLWFSSDENGLSRFDGKTFNIYSTAQGAPASMVWSLVEDKKGNIWLGTNNGGLSCYNGKTFVTYTQRDGLANNTAYKVYEDKSENLWISNGGGSISRFNGKSFTTYSTLNGLPNNVVNCFQEDKKGNIWMGTNGGGLCCFNGKSFIIYSVAQGLAHNEVTTIAEDNTGNLWIGTNGGGVSRFDGKSFVNFTSQQGLPHSCVWSIIENKSGDLWFGTSERGLSLYDGKSFANYKGSNELVDNDIAAMIQDNNENIWLGSYGGGITCFDGKKATRYSTKQGLSSNYVTNILQDKKGNLWIGTYGGGINYFDGKSFTIFNDKQGLSSNYVNSICEDKKGNIWIATDGGGINYLNCQKGIANANITTYTKRDGIAHNSVHCFLFDKQGILWMGTAGGLCSFDGKSFTKYTVAHGLGDNFVTQLLQDSAGRLFIGTNWGITVLTGWKGQSPIFEIYNKRTGYPVKDVNIGQNAMFMDSKGIVWAGTGDDKTALVRFDFNAVNRNPKPLSLSIQEIKINEENICWYTLANNDLKIDSTTLAQQEMMTLGKLMTEQERKDQKNHFEKIHFDGIMPYYPIPINLVLPYKHNHITFEFAAIEPSRPLLVKYQYLLKGYDETWSPISNKTNAVYGNIGEGTYTFLLKAQSPDGVWSDPIIYTFKVLPPWYRTILAYSIYSTLFFLILIGGIKKYTNNLLKEKILLEEIVEKRTEEILHQKEEIQNKVQVLNQEVEIRTKTEQMLIEREVQLKDLNATKDKLFSIIAHDLRSPFSGILGFLQLLQHSIGKEPIEQSQELINHIYSATKNSYNLLETLLDWAKTQTSQIVINKKKINISELINNTLSDFQILSAHKKIVLVYTNPNENYVFADENMVNTILRNLISNSIKYTKMGGLIAISVYMNSESAEISVADNGVGIKSDLKDALFSSSVNTSTEGTDHEGGTGLGLVICKEFVEKLGGKISVESEEGYGSNFKFTLPKFDDSME